MLAVMHRVLKPLGLICALAGSSGLANEAAGDWREVPLERVAVASEHNALVRWRPEYPRLFPEGDNARLAQALRALSSPLESQPQVGAELRRWLEARRAVLETMTLREDERLWFPELLGPETPFPDHRPLRQLAVVRLAALKVAWWDGDRDRRLDLPWKILRSRVLRLPHRRGWYP